MRCIVYNIEDPGVKDFHVQVNADHAHGQIGVEIDLHPKFIHALENAVIDTMIKDIETNKAVPYKRERFRIVKLEKEQKEEVVERKPRGNPHWRKKESPLKEETGVAVLDGKQEENE